MTKTTGKGKVRYPLTRKMTACVCAAALAFSMTSVAALDHVSPEVLGGGQAYAAQGASLKAGMISATKGTSAAGARTNTLKTQGALFASEATQLVEGNYQLANVGSSLYLDVPSGAHTNNLQMQLWYSNKSLAQTFQFKKVSTDVFTIQSARSGKYLADYSGRVVQQGKSASLSQRWRVVKEGNDLALKNMATGRMLAASGTKAYSKLVTRAQSFGSYEKWRFTSCNLIRNGMYGISTALGGEGTLNRMLDVDAASRANGANVQIWDNNATNAQRWQITHVGGGYYRLVNAASGKALDLNCRTGNVRQYTVGSYATELWRVEISDKGGLVFVNKYNGKALDVSAARNANGTNVQTYAKNNTTAQRWYPHELAKVTPGTRNVNAGVVVKEVTDYNGLKTVTIPSGTYILRNVMGRSLDVSAGSSSAGANIQIWDNNNTNAQKWVITSVGNGFYTLKNAGSGLTMDVENGRGANGTNVRQWYHNGSVAQRWKAQVVGSSLVFVNEGTGKALDIDGAVNQNGRNVQIWDRNDSNAQLWRLTRTTKSVSNSSSVPSAPNSYTPYSNGYAQLARGIFDEYNNYRASKGLPRVAWDDSCANIAYQCSLKNSTLPNLTHGTAIPNYRTNWQDLCDILQMSSWPKSASGVVSRWQGSTGHRKMMQCTTTTKAGVGVYRAANGYYYYTIVYNFSGTNQGGC